MKVRILTAIGIFIVGVPILIFSDTVAYPIALSLLSVIAAWEMLRVFGLQRKYAISIPSYLIALCLPLSASDIIISSESHRDFLLAEALVLFAFLMYLAAAAVLSRGHISFESVSRVFISVCYVTVSFSSMSLMRYMVNGGLFVGLIFTVAWTTDTFAYFTGRLFGKHKLAPGLSPKKTVEGAIGGTVFAVVGCIVYGLVSELLYSGVNADFLILALIGLVCSVISQIGDLWASLIKREYGVKDYSRILPGHGGVMDRFDSILAVSAVLYAICMVFPPIK